MADFGYFLDLILDPPPLLWNFHKFEEGVAKASMNSSRFLGIGGVNRDAVVVKKARHPTVSLSKKPAV